MDHYCRTRYCEWAERRSTTDHPMTEALGSGWPPCFLGK
jgi:hypothetical protein